VFLPALARPNRTPRRAGATDRNAIAMITGNQRQILLRLFAGSPVTEIAKATGRKPSTVANTLRRVRAQMGARSDVDLLRECLGRQLVTLGEIFALADELHGKLGVQPDDPEGGAAVVSSGSRGLAGTRSARCAAGSSRG
jgi:DNA-binding CsgD family transcriptional regulator